MHYKLAIFDMDGTILDTLVDLAHAINYTLAEQGFPIHTIAHVRQLLGNGSHYLITHAAPEGTDDTTIAKMEATYASYYKAHCTEYTKPFTGIIELINELREQGMLTAVVSNKPDYGVQILVKEHFPHSFDYAVGEKTGIAKKPSPDTVNATLRELGIRREEAVYIGDSEVDIATAINAKMDAIIVTWGFRDEPYLKEQKAPALVHNMKELRKALLK